MVVTVRGCINSVKETTGYIYLSESMTLIVITSGTLPLRTRRYAGNSTLSLQAELIVYHKQI